MQFTNKHNQALYFLLVASMFFLEGNKFLRKSYCKLATCFPKYHAIFSSYLFKIPVLHLNITLHTFYYAYYNYWCITDQRLCYNQWDARWLYPVFFSTWKQVFMSYRSQPILQYSFLLNIFLFHQARFLKESDWEWNSCLACIYCLEKG